MSELEKERNIAADMAANDADIAANAANGATEISPAVNVEEYTSPPSPITRKPSRRSSAACARRLSRASTTGGGIPLEDLLATVPPSNEASVQERLAKVVQLALASTVRGVVATMEEEEEGDAARCVGASIRQVGVDSGVLERVTQRLEGGVEVEGAVVGEQVRKVREYTQQLQGEGQRWKELLAERKEMVRNVERNARAAAKGEIVVTDDQRFSLSAQEKTMLNKLPDYKAAVQQLVEHEDRVERSARAVASQAARLKRNFEEVEGQLGQSVRKLLRRADTVGGWVEELEAKPGKWFGDTHVEEKV